MEKRFLRTQNNTVERRFQPMNQMYKIYKQKGLLHSIFQGYFFHQIASFAQLRAGVHPDTHCHIILFSKKTAIKGKICQPPGCHTDLLEPLLCFQKFANKRVSKKQKVEPAKMWQKQISKQSTATASCLFTTCSRSAPEPWGHFQRDKKKMSHPVSSRKLIPNS